MTIEEKFIYSELIPAEAPFNINLLNLIQSNSNMRLAPIQWAIYEAGKIKTITCPPPSELLSIYNSWAKVENSFIEWNETQTNSFAQIPSGKYKANRKKNIYSLFNSRYFKYKNAVSYTQLKLKAIAQAIKTNSVVSKIDIKSYFPSIYIHSIEWAFYQGTFIEKKNPKSKLKINGVELPKKIHDLALKLSAEQTNGLPIGPNLSRILSNIIGNKIDEIIKKTLKDLGNVNVKIFRFIDDIFIVHKKNISENEIDIIDAELKYLNLSINRTKLNLNKVKKDPDDWFESLFPADSRKISAVFNKLNKFLEIKTKNKEKSLKFTKNFIQNINELIMEIKFKNDQIKNFKAIQMNHLLKHVIKLSESSKGVNRKIKTSIMNFSIKIWKIILRNKKLLKNPAILNTFSPLAKVMTMDKRVEAKKTLSRIENLKWSEIADNCFPLVAYMMSFNKGKFYKIISNNYNLKFKVKGLHMTTNKNILNRITSSFMY